MKAVVDIFSITSLDRAGTHVNETVFLSHEEFAKGKTNAIVSSSHEDVLSRSSHVGQ